MGEVPKCRLCIDSNVPPAEADLFATVPMCGKRPRYPLCLPCYEDIAEECEDVTLVEDAEVSGRFVQEVDRGPER